MSAPIVDILLSTYNGAPYLQQQYDSIFAQTEKNWRLIVRDDGSSDETIQLVRAIANNDTRVVISKCSGVNTGIANSFFSLLQQSTAPFFAFCDQDDYWVPRKLETLLGVMECEPLSRPTLVYSDLTIVDENLKEVFPSFMHQQHFSPGRLMVWSNNLLQNTVVGCASMGNRELKHVVFSNPPDNWSDVIMHDWWLAIVASRFGQAIFEPTSTVLYRQHGKNQLGAKGTDFWRYLTSVINEQPIHKVKTYLDRVSVQAAAFQQAFRDQLSIQDCELLHALANIKESRGLVRASRLLNCYGSKVRMQTSGRDLLVLLASIVG